MPIGRPPKPTALHLLNGNPGKRPLNKNEPRIKAGAPDAPEHLLPEAIAEWDRICAQLVASGIMTVIDAGALAAYCQSYGRWVLAERAIKRIADQDPENYGFLSRSLKGNIVPNPLIHAANNAMRDMVRYAAEFGMTPSARSRIKATDAVGNSDNPFLQLKIG